MENRHRLFATAALCLFASYASAFNFQPQSVHNKDSFYVSNLLTSIDTELDRIERDYSIADDQFFSRAQEVQLYIIQSDMELYRKEYYLNYLHGFLAEINDYYSDSYFKVGRYKEVLTFFPAIIDYNERGQLLSLLRQNPLLAIKSIYLYRKELEAETFLFEIAQTYPDDILRNVQEHLDRPYVAKLIEEIALRAPISAKRYLGTNDKVKLYLQESTHPAIRKMFEIYRTHGFRAQSYLLIDAIVAGELSIGEAEEICKDKQKLFQQLVSTSIKEDHLGAYSISRRLEYLAVEHVRLLNRIRSEEYQFSKIDDMNADELFTILAYGHDEASSSTLIELLELIDRGQEDLFYRETITQLPEKRVKSLMTVCDQVEQSDQLLDLFHDTEIEYILAVVVDLEDELEIDFESYFNRLKSPSSSIADTDSGIRIELPTSFGSEDQIDEQDIQFNMVKIQLSEIEKATYTLKKDHLYALQNIHTFIDEPYAEEFLLYVAQVSPDHIFKKFDQIKHKFYSKRVLEEAARNAPLSMKRYLTSPFHSVTLTLQRSKDPVITKIFEMYEELGPRSRAYLLVNDIVSGEYDMMAAHSIASDDSKLFKQILQIAGKENHIGEYSIERELNYQTLRFIRSINNLEGAGSSAQFAAVNDFTAEEIYSLIVYGQEEVFQNTFHGLYKRMTYRLGGTNGYAFLNNVGNNKFRVFIKLCADFDRLDTFIASMPDEDAEALITAFASDLENEETDMSEIVNVADVLNTIDNPQLLAVMHKTLKDEFERLAEEKNYAGLAMYGLLSSIASEQPYHSEWWFNIVGNQYKMKPLDEIEVRQLQDESRLHYQQHFFYNDEDGKLSFANFLAQYKNSAHWSVEYHDSFVKIVSQTGNKVEIFANKPEFVLTGIGDIKDEFKRRNISPQVLVHRGHSFHTEKTLRQIPESTKLLVVGSCGGYYKLPIAVNKAPEAQIIATKQIGSMRINDPIIKAMNEQIRLGNDLVWPDFWDEMEAKLGSNPLFHDYIPPHKNLSTQLIKAYYQLLGV